jgi:exonuclease SbcD
MPADACLVMHFADAHFGVETYGRLDPSSGLSTRLLDFQRSLTSAIDIALDRGVHLAVFAGDAYKSREPSQTHQRAFAESLRRLTERDVPVVLLTGNHDLPAVRGRAHAMEIYATLGVRHVTILSEPCVRRVETACGPVQIAAMPYLARGTLLAREEFTGKTAEQARAMIEQRYAEHIGALAARVDDTCPALLLGHFWVREARLSAGQESYLGAREPQVALDDVAREAFDYVALGHIHRHQDLNRGASPPVVYAGSIDRVDFGERHEPRGFCLVRLRRGEAHYEFVGIPGTRPFIEIDVEADGDDPTETILAAIAAHSLRGAVVRLTYHVAEERATLVRDRALREALAPAFMVAGVRRDVRRTRAQRSRVLSEALDPATALALYLDEAGKDERRKAELMSYAEPLLEELRREEALA